MSRSLIFLVFFFFSTVSCVNYEPKKEQLPEKKEQRLPANAFWIAADIGDGYWINVVSIHNHKNSAVIEIYEDESRDLIVSRRYMLTCALAPDEIVLIEDLEKQISHYIGDKLYFKSSQCYLH